MLLLWEPQTAPWQPKAFQSQTQCTGQLTPLDVVNLNTQTEYLFRSSCHQGDLYCWTPGQMFQGYKCKIHVTISPVTQSQFNVVMKTYLDTTTPTNLGILDSMEH